MYAPTSFCLYLDVATAQYAELEAEYSNDDNINIVLISAESIRSLKKAYPNYFADSDFFLENLQRILD